ncbi:DNA-binding transcriptional regulator, FadR family [Micromonospora coxensis]|uniref:DNA-binding transcriptional regulator, FadR family n=2 Tax=Micromonospora coxensis TaxID=356852 RepID=A0A1C5GZ31_9ACTN|nr:DNA-binding transcriptional regulator, FadR family [Micromonospora coxensis]
MIGENMIRKRTAGGYQGRGLHGEVVELLGRRILSGELNDGETLDVPGLEQELDISRSVLREALRVLKAKGLVDARPKRGTFVQPRTEWRLLDPDVVRWQFEGRDDSQFLDDLAEMRGIIEPAGARLAALRRTDEDIAALEQAIDLMSAAAHGDGDAVDADIAFHRALLAATHNELLVRMEVVLETGLAARDRLVHGAMHDDDPTPAHAAVLDAVKAGDPEAAAAAAGELLAKSRRDIERARGANPGTAP